jgi:uncharacterized protein
MQESEFKFESNGRGALVIEEGEERLAEMTFGKDGTNLEVYHTQVSDKLKGQGVAAGLLEKMVNFAREENLQIVPLCPYVSAQFNRHPERYADIWNKHWHSK